LTLLVGGALTIDAPYMARLIGIIPVMAIFAAAPLNKLAAEFVSVVGLCGKSRRGMRIGQVSSAIALFGLLGFLTWQNYSDYYLRYLAARPFREVTGQAYFVRQMNASLAAELRPPPKYYSLGAHHIYWGYGVNRFLNRDTVGQDMANPSDELPIADARESDVVFMVWPVNRNYLDVIRSYYPNGIETPFRYGPVGREDALFTSYRVKKERLDARRITLGTYAPARGRTIERRETGFGSLTASPPASLIYPARVRRVVPFRGQRPGRFDAHHRRQAGARDGTDRPIGERGRSGPRPSQSEPSRNAAGP
jgi:hypothetical protein